MMMMMMMMMCMPKVMVYPLVQLLRSSFACKQHPVHAARGGSR
jgi:hypothetical protein